MEKAVKCGKTKIVATLGPSSSSYEMIFKLAQAGASMFRLNTSHGDIEQHRELLQIIRKVSKNLNIFIPVLVDLQGPKIRVGNLAIPVQIKEGQIIKLTPKETKDDIIPVDYDGIVNDVKQGDKILLDDGKIGLEVIEAKNDIVTAKVLYGHTIKSRKGINLPGATASLSAVTERDVKFIKFAVSMMRKIANNTENCQLCLSDLSLEVNDCYDLSPQAIANAAIKMAQDLNAKAILAFTHTGYTPKLLAKLRPSVPIIGISDVESTCRRLNLYWGITPYCRDWDYVLDSNMLTKIDEFIYKNTDFKNDERIIIIGSIPKLITGRTNFIRVHRIGAHDNR